MEKEIVVRAGYMKDISRFVVDLNAVGWTM